MKLNHLLEGKSISDLGNLKLRSIFSRFGNDYLDLSGAGLTSLKGCPKNIEGKLFLNNNDLTLDNAPHGITVNDSVNLSYNPRLTSLHNIHKVFTRIGNTLVITPSKVKSHVLGILMIKDLKNLDFNDDISTTEISTRWRMIIERFLPNPTNENIYECQNCLLELNLDEYAQL